MSLPLPSYDPVSRANWLGRYLAVERKFDGNLKSVLTDSLTGIDDAFAKHNRNFSDQVRRLQLSQSRRALRDVVGSIFTDTGNLVRNHRQDAAVAAIDAGLFDERSILARIFPSPVAREAYAKSLRQTGRRNIESVMTRVLETELPLSKRVYKTRALANGLVGKVINRALARGDSYKNLAADVKALIDPATPGGVSYAAKRLGRTEINNAFHAQSIHDAQEHPWIDEMEWHLSKVHVTDPGDECELYAMQRTFGIERVPVKPHPHCRCYVTPVLPDYDKFENGLISGHYDRYLDEVLGFDEDSAAIIDMRGLGPAKGPDYTLKLVEPLKVVGPDSGSWIDAPNHEALVYRFQNKWQGDPLLSTDNIQLVNFKSENVRLEDAKRMLASIDDNLTKYPQAQGHLRQIALGWGPDSEYARTIREATGGDSTIKFNLTWAKDHDAFYEHVKDNAKDGWHPLNTDVDPYYDMMTHEFGHVLDNVSGHRGQAGVNEILRKQFIDENDYFNTDAFNDWVQDNAPTRYSIDGWGNIDSQEAIAEGFLDFERNGDKAKATSKLLHKQLIDESKSPAEPLQLLDLVDASESNILQGDYVPNPVDIKDFIDVPDDRGRYSYREVFDPRNTREDQHDFTIEPKTFPAKETYVDKFDRKHNIFYDPAETELSTDDFNISPTVKEVALEDTFKPPEGLIWRGMSSEEYELGRKRGYFKSLGEYNVGGVAQEGKTYFSSDLGQAGHYATWFSPPQFKPTFDHPGYVIGIPDISDIVREQGTEIGVVGKIPFSKVQKVYVAKPYAITPGQVSVVNDWSGWTQGGGHQISARVKWREIEPKALDQSVSRARGSVVKPPPKALAHKVAVQNDAKAYFKSVGTNLDLPYDETIYPPTTFNQLMRAHKKLHDEFPEVNISTISIDDLGQGVQGQTFGFFPRADRPKMDQTISSEIVLSHDLSKNPDTWKFWATRDAESGFHPPGSGISPIVSTYNHEFAHALINSLGSDAYGDLLDAAATQEVLMDAFEGEFGIFVIPEYRKWLRKGLSGYSFENKEAAKVGSFLLREAYPEAFDAVQRLGNKASEPEKVLYNRLIDAFNAKYRPQQHLALKTTGLPYLDESARFLKGTKKITPKGFLAGKQLDPIVVDEAVSAVDKITKKFPNVTIQEFGFGQATDQEFGFTEMAGIIDMGDGIEDVTSRIILNQKFSRDYATWKKLMKESVDDKWHYIGSDEKPLEGTVFHEFAHAMQNALGTDRVTNAEAEGTLKNWFKANELPRQRERIEEHISHITGSDRAIELRRKQLEEMAFSDWKHLNMSGYSFGENPVLHGYSLNAEEAVAEAFEVTERLGVKAPTPAKLLHDLLVKRYTDYLIPIELEP